MSILTEQLLNRLTGNIRVRNARPKLTAYFCRDALVGTLECDQTFGYITKAKREELELPKSHHNDAFVIAGGTTQARCVPLNLEQNRRNRRSLEQFYDAKYIDIRTGEKAAGTILFSGRRTRNKNLNGENLRLIRGDRVSQGRRSIRKGRYPYQQHDLILFCGVKYRVRGMQNLGTRVALYDAPKSTLDIKQVQPCKWRKGICEQINS